MEAALDAAIEDGLDDEEDAEAVADPVQDGGDVDDVVVDLAAAAAEPLWEWPFEEDGGFEDFQQQFPPFALATKGNMDNLWNTFAAALLHIQNLYDDPYN